MRRVEKPLVKFTQCKVDDKASYGSLVCFLAHEYGLNNLSNKAVALQYLHSIDRYRLRIILREWPMLKHSNNNSNNNDNINNYDNNNINDNNNDNNSNSTNNDNNNNNNNNNNNKNNNCNKNNENNNNINNNNNNNNNLIITILLL